KDQQRELHIEGQNVEQDRPEAGRITERGAAIPADKDLPGRQTEHPKEAEVSRADHVVTRLARHGQPIANENRTQQATCTSPIRNARLSRRGRCLSIRCTASTGSWTASGPALRAAWPVARRFLLL